MKISIVVPVFNEEKNLPELHRRLAQVLPKLAGDSYEIIVVDDGSRDSSWAKICELSAADSHFKGIKFSRNFGHHIAVTAGMDYASGEAVVLMDGDLQDQPEEIPKLYAHFLKGFDVVFGIRRERKHTLLKIITSRLFILFINKITGSEVPINSHIFRIMNRKVVDNLNKFRERERFITGLISYLGFKQVGVEVVHGARYAGETKYSWFKLFKLALNTVTGFSYRPLQLASYLGTLFSVISFLAILYLIILRVLCKVTFPGWTSIMVLVLFMGGIQMLLLGILGEYVGRNYAESQRRPLYIIDDTLGITS
jgi:glycosyltransferase involved in cell wall biosynthesis